MATRPKSAARGAAQTAARSTARPKKASAEVLLAAPKTRKAATGTPPPDDASEWERITVGFPVRMMPEVRAHAKEMGLSMSAFCVQAVRRWIQTGGA